MIVPVRFAVICMSVATSISVASAMADELLEQDVTDWREEHEARFKSPDGWLALVGMFRIEEGQNQFGTDPSNQIVLPAASSVAAAGTIRIAAGQVSIEAVKDSQLSVNDEAVTEAVLQIDNLLPDADSPDKVTIGDRLSLQLVRRNGRLAIRVRDRLSPSIAAFRGKNWFPVDSDYRVEATFTTYEPVKTIRITNIKGDVSDSKVPGFVEFTLHGTRCRLDAQIDSPEHLFFTFKDKTNGTTTCAPGRFLVTGIPKDNRVTLDFNKAYSPPCAFSEFTVCPLPPPQNHLDVAIEAGEKKYEP